MLVNIKIEVIVHTTKHEEEEEEEVEIEDASSLQSHRIQNCSMKITPSAVMHPGEGGYTGFEETGMIDGGGG